MDDPSAPPPPDPNPGLQKNCAPQGDSLAIAGADVPEGELARALGVPRDVLRGQRGEQGLHWTGGAGGRVMITPAGQERLQGLLSAGAGTAAVGEAVATIAAVAYEELIVVRITPRVLVAKKSADDPERVRILVKDSTNFLVGMKVPKCQPSTTCPGLYYFHGRLPRYRGRF